MLRIASEHTRPVVIWDGQERVVCEVPTLALARQLIAAEALADALRDALGRLGREGSCSPETAAAIAKGHAALRLLKGG